MKKNISWFFCVLALAVSFSNTVFAAIAPSASSSAVELEAAAVQQLSSANLWVGGAVGNYAHGKMNLKTYGVETPNGDQRPHLNAQYEIGSISKSFTGILLALAEAEIPNFKVTDAIGKYLPSVHNDYIANLTFQQLATHSAGFDRDPTNMDGASNFDPNNPYGNYTEGQLLEFLNSAKPDPTLVDPNHPGQYLRNYSNVGFATLGFLMTEVFGKSFDSLVKEKITEPLEMHHTFVNRKVNPEAHPHFLSPYGVTFNLVSHMTLDIYAPAGAIVSTIPDMMKYLKANLHPSHLHPSRGRLGQALNLSHKLGLGWDSSPGDGIVWKNGETYGFTSFIGFNSTADEGVVVLSNTGAGFSDFIGAIPLMENQLFPTSNLYSTYATPTQSGEAILKLVSTPITSSLITEASGSYSSTDKLGVPNIILNPETHTLSFSYQGETAFALALQAVEVDTLWLWTGGESYGSLRFTRDPSGKLTGFTIQTSDTDQDGKVPVGIYHYLKN